ncbi:MAG: hypothetical protein ACRCYX_15585 [Dermatophilaceae bacterium]
MADYKAPVKDVCNGYGQFAGELVEQLDETDGGFPSWGGHTDGRRFVLLADYLIQSTSGVAAALLDAALAALEHRQQLHADRTWLQFKMQKFIKDNPNAPSDNLVSALQRNSYEERRDRRIGVSAVHTLVHLVQALDRAAAMITIVAGVKTDPLKVGWPDLDRFFDGKGKAFGASTDDGVQAQRDLVNLCREWAGYGPSDWLPWMLQARNASAHRAPTTSWNILTIDQHGRPDGFARPLYRRPAISEMHALADPNLRGPDPFRAITVYEHSYDTLDGLVESMAKYLKHIRERTQSLWCRRLEEPDLIIQPGTQWTLDAPEHLGFNGYGSPFRPQVADQAIVDPALGKRIRAAKVLDHAHPEFWVDQ